MQNAALLATGLGTDWRYQLLPVPPERFAETVRALPAAGFRGVNVTIPHKEAALALATDASPRASAIGAANTLLFEPDERIWAENTDAPALVQALAQHVDIEGASALVLGAGGSARAAVWALIDAGARQVLIWNRSPERAEELAGELGAHAVGEPLQEVELLINCTPVGMRAADTLETLPWRPDQLDRYSAVADFVYRKGETPLIRAARSRGVPAIDGLELLIGQGAIAFELFTGKPAPTDAMRSALALSSAP